MISLENKMKLEAAGYRVLTIPYDERHKTDTMIVHPDGVRAFGYADWYSVPYSTLQNGEAIDVTIDANIDYPNNFDMVATATPEANVAGELLWQLVLLIVVITVIILATCVVWVVQSVNAPCGIEGQVTEVSECEKIIVKPDCSSATFNICYDGDGDGIYEGRFTSPWTGGNSWITWIILGVVAVAGVYIIAKVLPSFLQKKQQPQYYAKAPGIDYVY